MATDYAALNDLVDALHAKLSSDIHEVVGVGRAISRNEGYYVQERLSGMLDRHVEVEEGYDGDYIVFCDNAVFARH